MTTEPLVPPSDGLLVTFYGDDFTGSTDVMETLEDAGVPTLLYLDTPTPEQVAAHPEARAVGVAGVSRTMTPEQMDEHLPPVLEGLVALGAPLVHYKICSTFDSSPRIGSIGHAAELLRAALPGGPTPLVVGVPQLGRYTAFGTLFAAFRGEVYRLDRHPTMTVHPMTPMQEADLRQHLRQQTELPVDLVDLRMLDGDDDAVADRVDTAVAAARGLVLLDVADAGSQRHVGRALHRMLADAVHSGRPAGVIGSSGIEYALSAAWERSGTAPSLEPREPSTTLVVSGSRAPATEAQVAAALDAGFLHVEVDPVRVTDPVEGPAARAEAARRTASALAVGDRVLLRTPPPVPGARRVDGTELAAALGAITAAVVAVAEVPRLVVAGGDTSGFVARALRIDALRLIRRLAPGAPLCSAMSADPRVDGIELCLKAGQIGAPDYFVRLAALGSRAPESVTVGD